MDIERKEKILILKINNDDNWLVLLDDCEKKIMEKELFINDIE